ncbi:MAG: DUF6636 domain-containing protein [Pseudomonadota bacterium]
MKWLLLVPLLVLPGTATADGYGFMTPSTNICCNGAVLDGYIDCAIIERDSEPTLPRPAGCAGVWGHDFRLAATGPAEVLCSDSLPGRVNYTDIAPYGQSGEFGPITCRSEQTGLTCVNQSGHGFFLSRRVQQVF